MIYFLEIFSLFNIHHFTFLYINLHSIRLHLLLHSSIWLCLFSLHHLINPSAINLQDLFGHHIRSISQSELRHLTVAMRVNVSFSQAWSKEVKSAELKVNVRFVSVIYAAETTSRLVSLPPKLYTIVVQTRLGGFYFSV